MGNNEQGQCSVSNWRDIVAIAAGCAHTVGLKADGTVVAAGNNDLWSMRCERLARYPNIESLVL